MTESIETEVKIEINNLEGFVAKLLKNGAVLKGKDFQRTVRMDTPGLDLEKRKVFLRVRSGLGNTVTLKVKKEENKDFKLRDEYETEVKDTDVLTQIFTLLGFSRHFVMEKYRAKYSYGGVEVSVDELPFGIYVEFEGTKERINNALKVFRLDKTERITVTYWHIFDEIKKKNPTLGENIVFPEGYKSKLMELRGEKGPRPACSARASNQKARGIGFITLFCYNHGVFSRSPDLGEDSRIPELPCSG